MDIPRRPQTQDAVRDNRVNVNHVATEPILRWVLLIPTAGSMHYACDSVKASE